MPHKKNLPIDIEKSRTKPGFLNIFRWFSKEKSKCRSSTNLDLEANENFANGSLFIPLKHSASADNAGELISAHGSSSIVSGTYSSNYSTFDEHRSKSVVSSPSSLRSSSDFAALKGKKRHAPVPPKVRKLNASFNPFHRSFDSSSLPGENELSKTRSESFIYSKFKRKAPLPPNSFQTEQTPKKDKSKLDLSSLSIRPSSTFSNVSSFSYSTSSTLQSTTCSEDGTSNCSEKSKCHSLFPVLADKEPISPRPWYKRKSSKGKNEKKKILTKGKEKIYDMHMPDIQYSRPNKGEVESAVFNANSGQFKDINRLSFLSSISDLDRAAVEHIKREKAQKQAARIEHDLTFYKASSTIILNQEHVIPNKQDQPHGSASNTNGICESQIVPVVYDNLHFENEINLPNVPFNPPNNSSSPLSKGKNNNTSACNGSFLEFISHSELNELQNLGVNYDEYLEEIRREINDEQFPVLAAQSYKETPKQRAVFDPELFYQLAKDAKVTCGAKLSKSPSIQSPKKTKQELNSNNNLNKSPVIKRSPKNFGMRMNNFFTPDVSIILEASESVTSSNTTNTPAEDFAPTSTFNVEPSSDLMSVASDLHSELRVNTCDLQEIIESFALDFRRKEGGDNRSLDCKETKSKSDRIREEILLLREKDNFLAWQKAMQEIDYNSKTDLSLSTEKKKKWACDLCTLVNQPWRLHCEACGTLRPPNPKRVDEYQQPIDSNIVENNELSINLAQNRDIPSGSGQSESNAVRNSSWEKELQSYIQIFDGQANNIKHIDIGSVRNHLFSSKAERLSDELCSSYNETKSQLNDIHSKTNGCHGSMLKSDNLCESNKYEIELHHIRNARLRKFEQLQKSFDFNNSENSDDGPVCDVSNRLMEEDVVLNQSKEDKCFYKKDYKKSQILKPSGAVKNVVSIFNQLDQFNQSGPVEKSTSIKVVKRKHCFVSNSFKEFEKLFSNSESFHKEGQSASRCVSPIKADIDITSAINKFDEMAAIAEIEKINKPLPKATKWKPKFCIVDNSQLNPFTNSQEKLKHCNDNGNSTNGISNLKHSSFNNVSQATDEANGQPKVCKVSNQDSCDSVIKDGILYTAGESRKRSMSIGSGTFELFTAKDFANIEAHHSRKASPTNDVDAPTMSELSHPMLLPEIRSINSDRPSFNKPDMEVSPVAMGARQDLSKASGLESLKAKILGKEFELPEDSELVKILMRKIEDASKERRHSDLSSLMEDLAKLKISNCSMESDSSKVIKKEINYKDAKYIHKTDNVDNKSAMSKDGSFKTSSEGSITPVTSESSSVMQDFITNITEDDFLSLSGAENSLDTESGGESSNVIRRAMKVDPKRREVKSDFTSRLSLLEINTVVQEGSPFNVKMYVEDKSSHQGPLIVSVYSSMTLENLKRKVSEDFGFPYEVQRWILGRLLADDDSKNLFEYNVTDSGCPIFLYLVAPEVKRSIKPLRTNKQQDIKSEKESKQRRGEGDKQKLKVKHHKQNVESQHREVKNVSLHKREQSDVNPRMMLPPPNNNTITSVKSFDTNGIKDTNICNVGQMEHNYSPNGWICPRCTLVNPMSRPGCEACTTERPQIISEIDNQPNLKMNLNQAMKALESQGCVPNLEPFECLVCFVHFKMGVGVVLRDCLHQFCRDCLADAVKYSDTAAVKCPFSNRKYSCQFSLQQREIRDLLSEDDYRKHLDKSVKEAAGTMKNIFYCKTPDCNGFCQFEDNVNVFSCDVCSKINCLTCQGQHEGLTCREYQDELANKQDEGTLKTKQFFEDIIRRGDGIFCPQCSVMLVRKWGCDWMRCPMCKTEICWVTRGPRWGPGGQGDVSGGCKCGINGRKCHPKCTYCH